MHRITAIALSLAALAVVFRESHAQPANHSTPTRLGTAERVGSVDSPAIDESSGLAASEKFPGHFWTHNDNGPRPGLFLLDGRGRHRATIQLAGAAFTDWEALSSARWEGESWLVIGDVGDNGAQRETCRLYLVREPELEIPAEGIPPVDRVVRAFETFEFRYPDGPVDCEAMAVEPDSRRVWLVSKQRPGGRGARIAGGRNGEYDQSVIHIVELPEQPSDRILTARHVEAPFNRLLVSGMDFSPDGRLAVVRTMWSADLFDRGERTWEEAWTQPAVATALLPIQRQGEAICFDRSGENLMLTSEGTAQPFWRIPLVPPAAREPDRKE